MRHMTITIDGRTCFEHDLPDTVLPTTGDLTALLPDILKPTPGQPPTPLTRLTILTMLIDMMRQGLETSPILQPITATVTPHGIGHATITITMDMGDQPLDVETVDIH